MQIDEGRKRVVIEAVTPEIDCGRFPIKRTVGEKVIVEADIFGDGHDAVAADLLYRGEDAADWETAAMEPLVNDRWRGEFLVNQEGRYRYTVRGWVDPFRTWRRDLQKRIRVEEDTATDFLIGAQMIEGAAARASGPDADRLRAWAGTLRREDLDRAEKRRQGLDEDLARLMYQQPDRRFAAAYPVELAVVVDREKARFSAWYECFPRSCSRKPGRHGSFKDVIKHLPYVASMGFDVLYFPPVHPIGTAQRKGKNNTPDPAPDDVGSPWGIGAQEGGHKSVHPELGTLDDFRAVVAKARDYGMEVALDIAFQCSPDHPYVKEHPEWFRWRPDGTVQYAENPPKKYQDIYPFEFECERWRELWEELKSVFLFWIDQGVRIFRVDNPHTKPFRFWEWVIGEIKKTHPKTLFLAEAFTRPKVMYRLAKLGFTQSYTYFAWRNNKYELTQYFSELTQTGVREYFRPNLWPNTPDILAEYLQYGGRAAFLARLILASTLGASYGIYGAAFELCDNAARERGSEEYLNSEKYEIKAWDFDRQDSLKDLIGRVNRIRRENPALQSDWSLRFHGVDNDQIICYSKRTEDFSSVILVVVNLDPYHVQSGWVDLRLDELGIGDQDSYQAHDLLTEARYLWRGSKNFVQLSPDTVPAHLFAIRRRIRTERDFDYYL